MAFRLDKGTLRSPRKTPEGHLRVDAHITRTGVFEYRRQDGSSYLEYRPPEEVFSTESLASFEMRPITDDHPPEGEVTADNAKRLAAGTLGEMVRRDGDHVAATMIILDAVLVKKVQSGKVQVSCGYHCDVEMSPGVDPVTGKRYDAIQRNIRGNHVAIVDVGRAGPSARIRMDAYEMIDEKDGKVFIMEELQKMLSAALADAVTQRTRADDAEAKLTAATTRADTAEGKITVLESNRLDAAAVQTMVNARVALFTEAAPVLGAEVKLDGMTDREIKVAVLTKRNIKVDAKAPDAFVDGAYSAAVAGVQREDASHRTVRETLNGSRQDTSAIVDEDVSRRKMIDASASAWKSTPAKN